MELLHRIRIRRAVRRVNKSYEIDMCHGPLLKKILRYALPLMLSGMLQLFFNAADIVVVGQFSGHTALAAVGSTGALINLIINVFIGLSVGTNVLVAKYYGARQQEDLSETVHTSVLISVIFGGILVVIGVILAEPLLLLMGNPPDVIDQAALYMRIYFIGMPVMMLYNFGSAVLRAVGDTKRPLYFLLISGILNVFLNLLLVIVFHLGVAGVAIATVFSQTISAFLVTLCLMRSPGAYQLHLKQLRLSKQKLLQMARIGLPAGMQGAVFSLSNVLIQSSVNSFGSTVMAANTAAGNLGDFTYIAMNSFHQTALSFTGQNLGGKKYSRLNRILFLCLGCVAVTGLLFSLILFVFSGPLLGIYTSEASVVEVGRIRLIYMVLPYFLCGMMETIVGSLRGMGRSILPMIVSLTGACGLRVLWIYTVFQWFRSYECLLISYPISWILTGSVHLICYYFVRKKYPREDAPEDIPEGPPENSLSSP